MINLGRLALAALLVIPVALYALLVAAPMAFLRWIDPNGSFIWEKPGA